MEQSQCSSCAKLEGMAVWIGANLASVFFASLERFSCMNIATIDHEEEIEEGSNGLPLMLSVRSSSMPYRSDDIAFGTRLADVWSDAR